MFSKVIENVYWYETHKVFRMRHKSIGIIYALLKLNVILYVFGYLVIYKKSYQYMELGKQSTTYKLKGALNMVPENISEIPRFADYLDFNINPQDPQSVIVLTSIQRTENQSQGRCLDHHWLCLNDSGCSQGSINKDSNAIATGRCIEETGSSGKKFCEVEAWCPLESRDTPRYFFGDAQLNAIKKLTLFIKNRVTFDRFSFSSINIPSRFNKSTLAACRYDPSDPINKDCPIFNLSDILNLNSKEAVEVARNGAFFEIYVDWKCDLDFTSDCMPKYSFVRVDNLHRASTEGYNFRYSKNYFIDGTEYRNLYKASAIILEIKVKTQANKLDIVKLALSVGSGLALLGLTQVICKSLLIYILPDRERYKRMLIEERSADDAVDVDISPLIN